ncbi:hypothetical protein D9M69_618250 [compost metagenome]
MRDHLVAVAPHDHYRVQACLDVGTAGQRQGFEHRHRTADRVGARLADFTQYIDFVAGGGLEQHVHGHAPRQGGVAFIEVGLQLVDGHALQRYGTDFREAGVAVGAHGDFPTHAGAGVVEHRLEVPLIGQRAHYHH